MASYWRYLPLKEYNALLMITAASAGLSVPESGSSTKRGSTVSHCTKLLTPRISFTDDTIGKISRVYSKRGDRSSYRLISLIRGIAFVAIVKIFFRKIRYLEYISTLSCTCFCALRFLFISIPVLWSSLQRAIVKFVINRYSDNRSFH